MAKKPRNRYRISEVDGAEEDTQETLRFIHNTCFYPSVHSPDYDKGHWWLAYAGDEPVAFAGVMQSIHYTDCGYLNRSGVLDAHRGRGLQRRLIRTRVRFARRFGWALLLTDTTENVHSSNSLIREGFVMFEPRFPWAHKNSLYWKKEL